MILLILPPLTQLNTPYPSVSCLTAYLRQTGFEVRQTDLGIRLVDRVMRREWLENNVPMEGIRYSKRLRPLIQNWDFCLQTIEPVIRFLRHRDQTLQQRFADPAFWPNTKAVPSDDDLEWSYGTAGTADQARLLCTLFLEDICRVIQEGVDPHFELVRYGEKLCTSLSDFSQVEVEISKQTAITQTMLSILQEEIDACQPEHIGYSIPFPGNLLATLRCAAFVRKHYPHIRQNIGGGYVNTELRQMTDPTIFRYIDYISFDDGELPLRRIIEGGPFIRTLRLSEGGGVERIAFDSTDNIRFADLPAPDLSDLPLNLYLDTTDSTNPMQRLWSNGRWNKMMLAHGCYWHKCSFCDTSLDYICRFEQPSATQVVDRMEQMMEQSGQSGFHFVDEAAPPALLRRVAEEILRRRLTVSYWTNIRFEKSFDDELCYLLQKSGCIAVSGGLEVASERVLKLINKGVTIPGVQQTLTALRNHGILVHAYLMYGFPTQTVPELVESLDTVRHFFADGLINSAFWHRYAMTCHSPSGINPDSVGATHTDTASAPFANNEIGFRVPNEPDWARFTEGLNTATYNFMRGAGFDIPARKWLKL